jgi:Flp pilus assembly protein TadG
MLSVGKSQVSGCWVNRLWRRLRRNQSGATAIEFGMVIGPFLGLVFAIIEVAMAYFGQFSLELANQEAARFIRTGTAQKANMTAGQYKRLVCDRLPVFMSCNDLIIDVRSFSTFNEAANGMPNPFNSNGTLSHNFNQFSMGATSSVVVVSAYYNWRFFIGMPGLGDFTGKVGLSLSNMPDGARLVSSTFVFKTEPY